MLTYHSYVNLASSVLMVCGHIYEGMKPKLLLTYDDPETAGGLGGVDGFARARGITRREARSVLERNLAYSLHKPPHRRLAILPVLVFNRDQQWVAD